MIPKRRSAKPPPAPHTVEAKGQFPGAYFEVTSGNSGTVYRIVQDGNELLCPCEGFKQRRKCSHVDAVVAFAEEKVKAFPEVTGRLSCDESNVEED